ncbi:MAG: hypothetical protein AAGA30_07510 [Planctomycetota bacterium]
MIDAVNGLVQEALKERREQNRKARQDPFSLTRSRTVQTDLELVDDQISQLELIQKEFDLEQKILGDKFLEHLRLLEQTGKTLNEEFLESFKAKKMALIEQTGMRKKKVLLPHQVERLNQIATQIHIRDAGEGAAILHPDSAKFLGINDEQKARILERSVKINKKLEEEIRELKRKARDELLKELTPGQRKKLDEITGVKLDLGDQFKKIRIPKEYK